MYFIRFILQFSNWVLVGGPRSIVEDLLFSSEIFLSFLSQYKCLFSNLFFVMVNIVGRWYLNTFICPVLCGIFFQTDEMSQIYLGHEVYITHHSIETVSVINYLFVAKVNVCFLILTILASL